MASNLNKIGGLCRNVMPQTEILTRSRLANFSTEGLKVIHDSNNNQFYIELNNNKAFVDYTQKGNSINFIHTEVPEVFRGKGVAKILAEEIFTFAEKNKFNVKVECDYLRNYYDSNKDKYKSLKIS